MKTFEYTKKAAGVSHIKSGTIIFHFQKSVGGGLAGRDGDNRWITAFCEFNSVSYNILKQQSEESGISRNGNRTGG